MPSKNKVYVGKEHDLEIDPNFSELEPAGHHANFSDQALEEQLIADGGPRDALLAWKNGKKLILCNGHRRLAICENHGLKFRVEIRDFPSYQHARYYVRQQALSCRQYTSDQFDTAIADLAAIKKTTEGRGAQKKVAEQMGVSESTVSRAKKGQEAKDALPAEIREAVNLSEVMVSRKATKQLSEMSPEQQQAVVERLPECNSLNNAINLVLAEEDPDELPIIFDGVQNEVPDNLRLVFSERLHEFKAIGTLMTSVTKKLNELSQQKGGELLEEALGDAKKSMNDARVIIRATIPLAVCPYCKGKRKTCKPCDSNGWMNRGTYESVPKDKR